MGKVVLDVSGMHCGSCAFGIQMVLKNKAGVSDAKVDYKTKKAEIEFDSSKLTVEDLIKEIESIGYSASK